MSLLPRIWVDTDVALGAARGDVDDGFALAALLGAAKLGSIDLLGISTVPGNTSAAAAAACARSLAEAADLSVRIVPGPEDPERASAAGNALASLASGCEIVALGPLSNVAAGLRQDAGLSRRAALSVVGGNLSSRGFWPPFWPHEYNLARDRRSSFQVMAADWRRLVLFPLDVVGRMRCDASRLARFSEAGPVGAHLRNGSERWLARARWVHGRSGFPVWDLPAALAAAGVLPISVEERTLSKAQRRYSGIPAPVLCAVGFDTRAAWEAFDRLLSA